MTLPDRSEILSSKDNLSIVSSTSSSAIFAGRKAGRAGSKGDIRKIRASTARQPRLHMLACSLAGHQTRQRECKDERKGPRRSKLTCEGETAFLFLSIGRKRGTLGGSHEVSFVAGAVSRIVLKIMWEVCGFGGTGYVVPTDAGSTVRQTCIVGHLSDF